MKKVYVCENHQSVLVPWSKIKSENLDDKCLYLITFDHHTDVSEAFREYLYYNKDETLDELLSCIQIANEESINAAVSKLKNDEHIDAALRIGVIKKAFIISFDGSIDSPVSNEYTKFLNDSIANLSLMFGDVEIPEDKTYPDADKYIIGTGDYSKCSITDENGISEQFISYVHNKIKLMGKIDVFENRFILDIDLDYFHDYKSFDNVGNKFLELIKKAEAITIATEPVCVEMNPGMNADLLLIKMLQLINKTIEADVIDMRYNKFLLRNF